jgi:hypothetical protein
MGELPNRHGRVFSPQTSGFDTRNRPDYESIRQALRVELHAADFPFSEQLKDSGREIELRYAEIQYTRDDRFFAWIWPGHGKIWVMEKQN